MKKLIVLLLALVLSLALCACGNQSTNQTTKGTTIDTMYPDDVLYSIRGPITVEDAEYELRRLFDEGWQSRVLNQGVVKFDELEFKNTSIDSGRAIFWFDISVQSGRDIGNYRAQVVYRSSYNSLQGKDEYTLMTREMALNPVYE